jgi:hypothetical protein
VLAAFEDEHGVLEQLLRPGGEVEVLGLDDDPPAPRRLQELEAQRTPSAPRHLHALHLFLLGLDAGDLLQLRLGLA